MDTFIFHIPCKKQYVSTARLTASSVAAIAGFDVEKIEDIRISVGEACNNAVIHSLDMEQIQLTIQVDEEKMIISVQDGGIGFDPSDAQTHVYSIDEYEGSGLGLFIISALMDDVKIMSKTEEGTCITMTKKI